MFYINEEENKEIIADEAASTEEAPAVEEVKEEETPVEEAPATEENSTEEATEENAEAPAEEAKEEAPAVKNKPDTAEPVPAEMRPEN
jgi:hypothetical protein